MRVSAITVSALLGAGVIAHPFHLHSKRDDSPKLMGSVRHGNTLVNEYQVVKKVVVDQNGKPQEQQQPVQNTNPAPAPAAAPAPKAPAPKKPQTQEKIQQPAPQQQQAVQEPPKQEDTQTQTPPTQDLSTASTSSTCSKSEQEGGSASAWAKPPCSNGINWLTIINDMRKQWDNTLPSYKWSSKLSNDAYMTAQGAEKKGTVMVHYLYDDSYAQTIAQSLGPGAGPTKEVQSIAGQALKMWMCEYKKGPFCDVQTQGVGPDPQGHAKIFASKDYPYIGCYFMWGNNDKSSGRGMVTCDFGFS